jgi:type VI secretion system protein ImpK
LAIGAGLNPLVRAASPLLELAVPLRQRATVDDVEGLRAELARLVSAFAQDARASRIDTETVAAARYCLCTCIDEAISGTPWGSGVWASRSLLVTFHNEASGGERFFLILQRLAQDPARNVDVLELLYVILSLGFEGRYRVIEGGRSQLEAVRERLQRIIRTQRGAFEPELSVHWRPFERARVPLGQRMPPWVCAALAGVVIVATHIALALSLNRTSDPVFDALNRIHVSERPLAQMSMIAPGTMPAATATLSTFLAPEIRQRLISVREEADRSIVTIEGDNLFASGSATLDPAYDALIGRIAQALKSVPGKVVVTGHTDDQPLLSARFPSNWHLSQARAETVRAMLASITGTPARFSAEGRGDAEPLASNDTPAGRAKNRRVEITLLAPGASS